MADDIIARLRVNAEGAPTKNGGHNWLSLSPSTSAEAADLIEAQQAEIERLRAELQQSRLNHLTTLSELQDAAEQSRRLRAERTAERALADRLAVALQEMFDPSLRDATHDEVIGVWKAAQDTLAGWEEARRG